MKKILALILALLMVVSLVACGGGKDKAPAADGGAADGGAAAGGSDAGSADAGSSDDGAAAPNDTLNVAVANDAGTLSPCNMTSTTFAIVCQMMEPLWDVTTNGDVIMLLCESVDVVSDVQQTIHLRKDVKFHNGNPLTASDVLFSMVLHSQAGATGSPRVQTVDFEKTAVIDEHTLDLHLLAPTICNWTVLSQCMIYDEESYDEATVATNCIGTGPYKLVSYVPNSEIQMERNEEYWGTLANAKYLNCKILAEDSQRVNALETGLIDIASIATTDYDYVSGLDNLSIVGNYTGNYIQMNFNFGAKSDFCQNLDARRAIAHAIDRQAILNTVFLGHGKMMDCALVDYCFDFEDRFNNMSEIYSRGYDVEYAKQLAESAGIVGKTVQIMTDGSTNNIRIAEMVQAMVSQIGVTCEIVNYDAATVWQLSYSPDADHEISVGSGIAPNRRCGDLLLNGVRYSPGMIAENGFENNTEYLELAPLCMSEQDPAKLSDLLFKMIKWYQDELLSFPMFDIENYIGCSSKVDPASIALSVGSSGIRYAEVVLN